MKPVSVIGLYDGGIHHMRDLIKMQFEEPSLGSQRALDVLNRALRDEGNFSYPSGWKRQIETCRFLFDEFMIDPDGENQWIRPEGI